MRTHNGMLVSFPGADGMKTGFICDSGFNIVVSATREGRRLVAVVLGEQSLASRRDRATDLLENGFQRYFWKSLFGTSLDGLAIQASLSDVPTHLHDNDGEKDLHQFPFAETGTIDWKNTMELLRSHPEQYPLLLELHDTPDFLHSLPNIKEIFAKLESV